MNQYFTPEVMRVLRYIIAVSDVAMQVVRGEIEAETQEEAIGLMRSICFVHGMDEERDQDVVLAMTEILISTVVEHVSADDVEGLNTDLLALLPGASEARN